MRNPFRRKPEVRAIESVPWDQGGPAHMGGISQERALSLAPVFSATRILAGTISTLPLKAYRALGDTKAPMPTLPVLFDALRAEGQLVPWLHECMTSLVLRGNAYGLITSRDGYGYPTQILWLCPSDVSVRNDLDVTNPVWYWRGRQVPREDMLHIPWFKTAGRILGLSPIGAFAATINTGTYAQAYGNDWFEGGGFPPGQMRNTVQGALTQPQADEIRARLVQSIRDRRPLVTGSDWEYKPITVPPNEAQFLAAMQLSATQVANIYGLPPEDVGGSRGNSLTYATVELNQLERALAMRPWLVRLEHAFSAILPERQYVRFNADAMVRTDLRTRWDTYQIAREIGVRSVDEIRALEELEPLPNGVGNDFTPLKAAGKTMGQPDTVNGQPMNSTGPAALAPTQKNSLHDNGTGATVTDLKRWADPA